MTTKTCHMTGNTTWAARFFVRDGLLALPRISR